MPNAMRGDVRVVLDNSTILQRFGLSCQTLFGLINTTVMYFDLYRCVVPMTCTPVNVLLLSLYTWLSTTCCGRGNKFGDSGICGTLRRVRCRCGGHAGGSFAKSSAVNSALLYESGGYEGARNESRESKISGTYSCTSNTLFTFPISSYIAG
jgi:hypothetical protein